ncbi:MAG: hypothetical protein K0R48_715 [Gammaproteobacteria bacterium]|jgi:hypothetical protein|nr:hypothetical protein [Gammaproteobacteria bacterium]
MNATHSLNEFYDHVTQTAAELEEIRGDLYALESMISIAHDIEDLKLYQIHCRRLEATIYTLHEKIGSWQRGAKSRRERLHGNGYKRQATQLDKTLSLVEGYIIEVCKQEEQIMQLQQLMHDRESNFIATYRIDREQETA